MHKDFRVGLLTLNVFLDYPCWDTDCQHAGWKVTCYDRSCTDNSYRTDVQVVDERCSNPNVNPLANPAPSPDVGAGSNVGAVCNLHVVTNKCTAIDHDMRPDLGPSCNHTPGADNRASSYDRWLTESNMAIGIGGRNGRIIRLN